ncbi:MAG TPA: hypothetical protein VH274_02300 [Mycobacteriales bacterium]|nr:hypothetical protein [Mycobacteriales bacterium]
MRVLSALPTARLRAIPRVPWSATDRWRPRPSTLVVLLVGLWLFGTGEALLVASHLGNTPWTVLAQGVSRHSALSIGEATFAISLVVLLAWIPLRERPGLGTIANAVVIAVAIDAMLRVLPQPHAEVGRLVEVVAAIACIGIGSGLYLTTWLGPGPRDGWMTGLARRTGVPIATVRLSIELTALVSGWLLDGRVGLGTVVFALTIGYAVSLSMTALGQLSSERVE